MMSSISKIHFNSSTGVSLNDRFTIMSKVSSPERVGRGGPAGGASGGGGGSSGSFRKRSNSVDSMTSRGSLANRALVSQLDRRHVHGGQRASALGLRNRNIRSGRQRLNRSALTSRVQLRRAAGNTLTLAGGSRRMQRSNSLSDIATMNADFFERQSTLRRSNSQLSIASRLGNNPRSRSRGRVLQRTNSSANLAGGRSRSRGRSRSNSRSRLPMPARGRLSRSRSRGNLAGAATGRARSRSAATNGGLNGAGGRTRGGRPLLRRNNFNNGRMRARSASRGNARRSGSVNGRLGANRTNRPQANGAGVRGGRGGGRIAKRGLRRGTLGAAAGGRQNGAGGRPGRTLQRGGRATAGGARGAGTTARRGRSRSRTRATSQTRARSGQRGRNASKGRRASAPSKSKEQLDNELDQYMANTKSSLDKEMDEYMNGIHGSTL